VKAVEDGFRGVAGADLRHLISNGYDPLKGTPIVQSSLYDPQGQTALVERVEEKVQPPVEERGRQSRRLLVPRLIAGSLVFLVIAFLLYRTLSNRNARTGREVQRAASSRMRIVPLTNLPGWVGSPAFSTPVLQLEGPSPGAANLAASRDGQTLWSAQHARHSSLAMAENFQ